MAVSPPDSCHHHQMLALDLQLCRTPTSVFLLMGCGFKPWARSSRDNRKTIELFQCSLQHRDIIYFH